MRVLLLSDTHANVEALNAVLESAPPHDQVWNLGDVVDYGANPNEIIDISQSLGSIFVRGNHDKVASGVESFDTFNPIAARAASWTRSALTPKHLEWLRQLPAGPITVPEPQASCSHGSPLDEDQYVVTFYDAYLPLKRAPSRINFFGHTHIQGAFAISGEDWYSITPQYSSGSSGLDEFELPLRQSARYLINPGSVGQPRDRDWRAAFAIFETEQTAGSATMQKMVQRVTFYRAPYDVKQAQQKILDAGLPDRLAARLAEGR